MKIDLTGAFHKGDWNQELQSETYISVNLPRNFFTIPGEKFAIVTNIGIVYDA